MLKNIIIFSLAIFFCKCNSNTKEKVDLILHNAVIYTVDSAFTKHEAMAVKNGTIVEVNSTEIILKKYYSEKEINVEGKTVLPGLIDAHCHFTGYATDMWKCNLTGTNSFKEVIQKIKLYSENAQQNWLYGRGWDQNDWEKKEFPDKEELDKLFPNRPVFLKRIDGHAALVNQKALDLAKVNEKTKINGGSIELKNGKPTGILIDNAMDLVDRIIPLPSDSMAIRYYQKAEQTCFSYGLTQVHDCGISEHTVELLEQAILLKKLRMKVFALLSDDSSYYDKWINKGVFKFKNLTVGGFKVYADGALGSRGACLLHPYSDKKNWSGFMLTSKSNVENIAEKLLNSNMQLCTHAIGDSANRQTLNIYGNYLKGKNNRRWRIEHAQVVNEKDFGLFEEFSIIPSVQPTHATSDMYWAGDRLGEERIANAYAYKKLLHTNGVLPLGTDFPVEDISPFKTFYAAVARKDAKGFPEKGFQFDNALTREEALRGMTIWAAYACFDEQQKGSLEKGKVADFIILDTDIMNCASEKIIQAKVISNYINGENVFENKK